MNTSSQTPPGTQRLEPSPLLEHSLCGARRPGYVLRKLPCVRDPHADSVHMDVHGVTWPATSVQAATGVIRASMKQGRVTPAEIATAEEDAGLLFDPERSEQIATAAREQAAAEYRAELDDLREQLGSLQWFKERLDRVRSLCVGRPDWYAMTVREILTATDTEQSAMLPLTWDRTVRGPAGDAPDETTLIPCHTSHGSPALLALDDEQRLALGSLLLASLHIAEACTTTGCGLADDELDASDPTVSGWILLDVAGTEGGPRWWCSPSCANSAITAAGAELAEADRRAELDGGL